MAVHILTDNEFSQTLASHDRVIVKYYADWCGSCKLFAPKYRRLSEDERFANVTFVDINAEENPDARKLANVDNLPFFATFKDGKLLEGGATAKEDVVLSMLEKVSS